MTSLLLISAVLNLALVAALWVVLLRLRARLAGVPQADEAAERAADAELARALDTESRPPMLITIRLLNPLALAARESWFARTFGATAPNAIRRMVYDKVSRILQAELLDQGVEAEVRVRRA